MKMSHIYKKEKENLQGEITFEGIWWHEIYFYLCQYRQ